MRVNIQIEKISHQKQILSTLRCPFSRSAYLHRLKHYRLVSMCHSRREGFHFQDVRVRFPSAPPSPRGPLVTSAVNSLWPINQQDQTRAHSCSCSCIRGPANRKRHQAQTAEVLWHTCIFSDFTPLIQVLIRNDFCSVELFKMLFWFPPSSAANCML